MYVSSWNISRSFQTIHSAVEEETKKLIANQNENRALIESKVEDESTKTRERVEDVGQKLREGQESIQEKMTTKDDLADSKTGLLNL